MELNLEAIKRIERQIINSDLDEAIKAMMEIFEECEREEQVNECIQLLARLTNFEKKANQGVIPMLDSEFAKVSMAATKLKSKAKQLLKSSNRDIEPKSIEKAGSALDEIFSDQFDNYDFHPFKWEISEEDDDYVNVSDSRLLIDASSLYDDESIWVTTKEVKLNSKRDFTIKCRVTFLNVEENHYFGLIWGKGKGESYFYFRTDPEGFFSVGQKVAGILRSFSDWQDDEEYDDEDDPEIQYDNFNLIEIVKEGGTIRFIRNGETLYDHPFINLFGQSLGFEVCGCFVAVDSIEVWN